MKILAIEASSNVASCAILSDDIITAEYSINHKVTHSQTILPMIDEIVRMTETAKTDFDAIAVSGGPGSYTGLRIGSATAKGLGMALNIPIIHVPTLKAMAYNAFGFNGYICPIMDARRQQTYTGIYKFAPGKEELEVILDDSAITVDELVTELMKLEEGSQILFVGDGIPVFKDLLMEKLGSLYCLCFAPANMNRQRAASVAYLGSIMYKQGKTVSAAEHLPEYLRLSQAERELKEKNG